jgi:hypothetical protein
MSPAHPPPVRNLSAAAHALFTAADEWRCPCALHVSCTYPMRPVESPGVTHLQQSSSAEAAAEQQRHSTPAEGQQQQCINSRAEAAAAAAAAGQQQDSDSSAETAGQRRQQQQGSSRNNGSQCVRDTEHMCTHVS